MQTSAREHSTEKYKWSKKALLRKSFQKNIDRKDVLWGTIKTNYNN